MKKFELTAGQLAALDGMNQWGHEWEIAALAGVAGSGKTTLVGSLLRNVMDGVRGQVAVLTPTHKALSVVERVEGVEYLTVHSALGLRLKQQADGSQRCEPEGACRLSEWNLVVVDEASMIGPDIYGMLIDPELRQGCAVLFVGDPMQLAPVADGPGSGRGAPVQLSPVFWSVQRQFRLDEVVRQARENPIIEASIGVRDAIERCARVDVQTLSAGLAGRNGDGGRVAGVFGGGQQAVIGQAIAALERGEDMRVIAYRNAAVEHYNREIHRARYGDDAELWEQGERVVMQDTWQTAGRGGQVLRNSQELTVRAMEVDGDRDCFWLWLNGVDKSVPVPIDRARHDAAVSALFAQWRKAKFSTDAEERAMAGEFSGQAWKLRNSVANIRYAYASTVHKSQGSTFDTVLIDWRDICLIRDDAEFSRAVYVAITRTRQKLGVIA